MTIYLIRHGKTLANEKHLYCGSTDLPLSEAGVLELKNRQYSMTNVTFLTSGMARTEQTLAVLFGNVTHSTESDFREVDFGAFEMRSYGELKDDPAYQAWLSGNNEKNVPPGGESGEAMVRRVLGAFGRVRATGRDTVIVTHGGVIAAVMAALFPEEGKNRYQWQPEPGCGYAVTETGYRTIPDGNQELKSSEWIVES